MANKKVVVDQKLNSAVKLLVEKLTQSGVSLKNKTIIIKNGELTIEKNEF